VTSRALTSSVIFNASVEVRVFVNAEGMYWRIMPAYLDSVGFHCFIKRSLSLPAWQQDWHDVKAALPTGVLEWDADLRRLLSEQIAVLPHDAFSARITGGIFGAAHGLVLSAGRRSGSCSLMRLRHKCLHVLERGPK